MMLGRRALDWRIYDLHAAAARLADGRPVDPAWIRVQLLDLADVLEAWQ